MSSAMVDDGEAVGRGANLGEVAPLRSRIGEEKGAVGLELRAEAEDGELHREPLSPVDRGAGFLADPELRRQRSLGALTAGAAAQLAGAMGLAHLAAGALRPIRAREGRPKGLGKGHPFLMSRIKLAPRGGHERGCEFSLAGSSAWRDF
jgi:hypothetical protein